MRTFKLEEKLCYILNQVQSDPLLLSPSCSGPVDVLLQINPSNQLKRKAEEVMHADNAKKVAKSGTAPGASPQSKAAAAPTANGGTAAVVGSMRR